MSEKKNGDEAQGGGGGGGGRRTQTTAGGWELGGGVRAGQPSREARQFARVENISYLYASTAIKQ